MKQAANKILKAVAQGKMSPEDGQKSVAIIEAARKAVETFDGRSFAEVAEART